MSEKAVKLCEILHPVRIEPINLETRTNDLIHHMSNWSQGTLADKAEAKAAREAQGDTGGKRKHCRPVD